MPARLRPTAPIAADAVLVGDPGRALTLAQALLKEPKMSNHARGLWGYSGLTRAGHELSIQATGMGGPSAGHNGGAGKQQRGNGDEAEESVTHAWAPSGPPWSRAPYRQV